MQLFRSLVWVLFISLSTWGQSQGHQFNLGEANGENSAFQIQKIQTGLGNKVKLIDKDSQKISIDFNSLVEREENIELFKRFLKWADSKNISLALSANDVQNIVEGPGENEHTLGADSIQVGIRGLKSQAVPLNGLFEDHKKFILNFAKLSSKAKNKEEQKEIQELEESLSTILDVQSIVKGLNQDYVELGIGRGIASKDFVDSGSNLHQVRIIGTTQAESF